MTMFDKIKYKADSLLNKCKKVFENQSFFLLLLYENKAFF